MKDTQINDGGPAFPSPDTRGYNGVPGMTLRDWFAGMAANGSVEYANFHKTDNVKTAADYAYKIADAMLVKRERKEDA